MKISSKGKYAIQMLICLSQNPGFFSLAEISQKTGISKKYLEQIVSLLKKSGLVSANRGFKGGYKLNFTPADIKLYDILKITETSFLIENEENFDNFALKTFFDGLNNIISEYLQSVSLKDITDKETERLTDDYVI